MTALTSQSPSEIDAQLYELYGQEWAAKIEKMSAWDRIHRAADDDKVYRYGRHSEWKMTNDEARHVVAVKATNPNVMAWHQKSAQGALDKLDEITQVIEKITEATKPLNEEYIRRGRWTRAFLVTNGDGHVHSSMNCSTCNRGRYATSFQWMTEWSAKDEAAIVAAAGWRACTVCYPSAPVGDEKSLPTAMFSDEDRAKATAKAEREAAKAAREAKRIANAATKSGEPLVVTDSHGWKETFKTERAAIMWATDCFVWSNSLEGNRPGIQRVAEAIAEKRGVEVATVLAEIEAKGKKKGEKR